ncbi:MAG: HAD family hydrolase, partial [Mesorhizobium sp.]
MFAGRKFAAFLFDMDGTILNSIAAAERVWAAWAHRQGLDVAAFLPTIHGVRAIETIGRLALPGVDPAREA